MRCESIVTTHPGHAIEETAGLDLAVFACIIVVGGDGSIHEVLQVCMLAITAALSQYTCSEHSLSWWGNLYVL